MSVIFHEENKEFHLYNDQISYVLNILPNGNLGQVYYGKRLRDRSSFSHLQQTSSRSICCNPIKEIPFFSLEHTRQEYPAFGNSDFRQPAYEVLQENGSHVSDLQYCGYNIISGKKELCGLPYSYVEDSKEADTLEIVLKDPVDGLAVKLSYTIYRDYPVITRSVHFKNEGSEVLRLNRALSMSVDFADSDYEWMQFSGAWARERAPKLRKLEMGVTSIESMRGHSSSQENPFVILKRTETNESAGIAYGFSFVYSGNFLAFAEVDTQNVTRFAMGINPRNFSWKLVPGSDFQTPEVIMTFSDCGLNGLSSSLHQFLQRRVARGPWRDQPRPILLNNWEATYMDFTEEKIVDIARKGAEVGVELFVLDDGWFGNRSETSGLGDWYVNDKLPNGVKGLAQRINELGLSFGIWIEPEMVNEDSDLYRNHPEFVLCTPDRKMSLGRNQLVLDYSNPQVVDYIFDMLMKAFDGANISYIKWDMNRSITECYSNYWPADQQGEVYHRYILGMYSLYEKLLAAYPDILIESCASGGCRFDAGMLYYAPQAWCSDDTDAMERIRIQYGTSYGYPVSMMGAHVSASPNHQVGRATPLKTRANVAYFGAFGYEMDLNKLSDSEIMEVKAQVAYMKEHRSLFQFGQFYRLICPYEGRFGSWMVVSPDKDEAMVALYQFMNTVNTGFMQLPLQGLNPDIDYEIEVETLEKDGKRVVISRGIFGGDELMNYGLIPNCVSAFGMETFMTGFKPDIYGDFDSVIFHLKKTNK